MNASREACLDPSLPISIPAWRRGMVKAAWLAARQFAREPCDGAAASIARMVDESHFEFRGGRPRSGRFDTG